MDVTRFYKLNRNVIYTLVVFGAYVFFGSLFVHAFVNNVVEVPFGDTIPLLYELIHQRSAWELFMYQLGSHFQGVGFWVMQFALTHFGWKVSTITYLTIAVQLINGVLAYILVRRMLPGNAVANVLIPIMFFSIRPRSVFTQIPNTSWVVLPLFMLLVICLLLVHPVKHKPVWIALIGVFLISCGYGLIALPLLGLLLIIFVLRDAKKILPLCALIFFSISSVFLLSQYQREYTQVCALWQASLPEYSAFLNVLFVRFFGVSENVILYPILLVFWGMFGYHGYRAWRGSVRDGAYHSVLLLLYGYTSVFVTLMTIHRVCLGAEASAATRYMIFIVPALLGVFLELRKRSTHALGRCALFLFVGVVVFAEARAFMTTMPVIRTLAQKSQQWAQCYRTNYSITHCSEQTDYYPAGDNPTDGQAHAVFEYARKHKLLFFDR